MLTCAAADVVCRVVRGGVRGVQHEFIGRDTRQRMLTYADVLQSEQDCEGASIHCIPN